jgi:Fur family peroxide stress response transcriptional regulator
MCEQRKKFISDKLLLMEERCRQNKLSLTVQRRAILENLASRTDHPTADQIYAAIQGRISGISRTTVYRVLETFVQLGLAQKINNPEAKARFDADTRRHHHAICINCEEVTDIYADELDRIPMPSVGEEFDIFDYSVNFTGLCRTCRGTARPVLMPEGGVA